ncbi:MAG TPA: hypothetical protein VGI73_16150 [Solirubrobacterales bacterium]
MADDDRRRNLVELTTAGRDLRQRAARRVDATERRFLETLGKQRSRQLKATLQTLTLE